MTVVLSEKGSSSTWDKIPIQAQYRDAHLWQAYRNGQKLLLSSGRTFLAGSRVEQTLRSGSINSSGSLMKRFFLKLREKGFIWVSKRIANMITSILLGRTARKINGFKYIGRI